MSVIQIFILLVVAVVWWRLYARLKQHELTHWEFLEWFALWLAMAVVAVNPGAASSLAAFFGVGRGADLVVYLALLLVFYLLFKIFVRLEKLERQLTKLVRHLAEREAEPAPKSVEQPESIRR